MKRRKKGRPFKARAYGQRQSDGPPVIEVEPEEFAASLRQAEREVLPLIRNMQFGPGMAQLVLALHAQMLLTGDGPVAGLDDAGRALHLPGRLSRPEGSPASVGNDYQLQQKRGQREGAPGPACSDESAGRRRTAAASLRHDGLSRRAPGRLYYRTVERPHQ